MTSIGEFGMVAFSSLFAMVNPVSAAPIFLQLTEQDAHRRRQIALRATMAALIALVLFWAAGNAIFAFFGITVPAFKIVGGLIFLLGSLKAMEGRKSPDEEVAGGDPSVVPIGIPLIAGAGALSTVIVLAGQAREPLFQVALGAAIGSTMLLTFLTLAFSPKLISKLGAGGNAVLSSVMNLLTAVIGVQFIIDGVTHVAQGIK